MIIENNNFRQWDIEFLKKIKVLRIDIDMLVGFLETGNLAAPSMMRIVPRHLELLDKALASDDMILVFGNDFHPENASEFKTYARHAVINTKEAEMIEPLKKYEKYGITFHKNSTDLVQVQEFRDFLLMLPNLVRVEIIGVLSDVCVLNAAVGIKNFFDELNRDISVYVHADAIDTFDAPGHNADLVTDGAITHMESNGVKVLSKRKDFMKGNR